MRYNLTTIFLLFFLSFGIAQPTINELNTEDFKAIKIENILFEKIINNLWQHSENGKVVWKRKC